MPEHSPSTHSIKLLHETVSRRNAERAWTLKTLGEIKRRLIQLREERDSAVSEAKRLAGLLAASEKEKTRLAKRERELTQEVAMMAAAIDVANREIAEDDQVVMEAAASIEAEFGSALPSQPKGKAAPQVPQRQLRPQPEADRPALTQPQAPQSGQSPTPQAVKTQAKPVTSEVSSLKAEPAKSSQSMPPADMPEELTESFNEIERMLEESLRESS